MSYSSWASLGPLFSPACSSANSLGDGVSWDMFQCVHHVARHYQEISAGQMTGAQVGMGDRGPFRLVK